jgi:hypothetical protein
MSNKAQSMNDGWRPASASSFLLIYEIKNNQKTLRSLRRPLKINEALKAITM